MDIFKHRSKISNTWCKKRCEITIGQLNNPCDLSPKYNFINVINLPAWLNNRSSCFINKQVISVFGNTWITWAARLTEAVSVVETGPLEWVVRIMSCTFWLVRDMACGRTLRCPLHRDCLWLRNAESEQYCFLHLPHWNTSSSSTEMNK